MKSKKLSGLHPLAYKGVAASNPPNFVIYDYSPTSNDYKNFSIGCIWLNYLTEEIYMFTTISGSTATWVELYPASGEGAQFFDTDSGRATSSFGVLRVIGGDDITTFGSYNILTITLEDNITVDSLALPSLSDGVVVVNSSGQLTTSDGSAGQVLIAADDPLLPAWDHFGSSDGSIVFTFGDNSIDIRTAAGAGTKLNALKSDTGTSAVPVGGIVEVIGDGNYTTTASGNTITVNLANSITIPGDLAIDSFGYGALFSDGAGLISSVNGSSGQVIIGATGAASIWSDLSSSDGSIIVGKDTNYIDLRVVGGAGSGSLDQLDGDSGSATPDASDNIKIAGGANINTEAAGNVITINLDESISQPATSADGTQGLYSLDDIDFMHGYGTNNLFLGRNSGNRTLGSSAYNTGIGVDALKALDDNATNNVAFGHLASDTADNEDYNTCVGALVGHGSSGTMMGFNIITSGDVPGNDIIVGNDSQGVQTAIGNNVGLSIPTDSLVIGNDSYNNFEYVSPSGYMASPVVGMQYYVDPNLDNYGSGDRIIAISESREASTSRDGGRSWFTRQFDEANLFVGFSYSSSVSIANNDVIYFDNHSPTGKALMCLDGSDDPNIARFEPELGGFPLTNYMTYALGKIKCATFSLDGAYIYAGTLFDGVYRLDTIRLDVDQSWNGPDGLNDIMMANDGSIIGRSSNYIYSGDSSKNWSIVFTATNFFTTIARNNNGDIMVGDSDHLTYLSEDNGNTWISLGSPFSADIYTLFYNEFGNIWYAGGQYGRIAYFDNFRGSWQQLSSISNSPGVGVGYEHDGYYGTLFGNYNKVWRAPFTVGNVSKSIAIGHEIDAPELPLGTNPSHAIAIGRAANNNQIWVGKSGSGAFQQNKCHIAGIYDNPVTDRLVSVNSSDQLGYDSGWNSDGKLLIGKSTNEYGLNDLVSSDVSVDITRTSSIVDLTVPEKLFPGFMLYQHTAENDVTGDGSLHHLFNDSANYTKILDNTSAFSSGDYNITVDTAGKYLMYVSVLVGDLDYTPPAPPPAPTPPCGDPLIIETTNRTYMLTNPALWRVDRMTFVFQAVVDLDPGDYCRFLFGTYLEDVERNMDILPGTFCAGYKL